jgi:hypothetical protein
MGLLQIAQSHQINRVANAAADGPMRSGIHYG